MDNNPVTAVTENGDVNETTTVEEKLRHDEEVINGISPCQLSVKDETLVRGHANLDKGNLELKPEAETDTNNILSDRLVTPSRIDESQHNIDSSEFESFEDIYDDTKPKRLKQPKTIKHDDSDSGAERIMHGIDFLISPDEHPHRSPTRRKGVSASSFPFGEVKRRPVLPYEKAVDMSDGILHKEISDDELPCSSGMSRFEKRKREEKDKIEHNKTGNDYRSTIKNVENLSGTSTEIDAQDSSGLSIGKCYIADESERSEIASHQIHQNGFKPSYQPVNPKENVITYQSYEDELTSGQSETASFKRRNYSTGMLLSESVKNGLAQRKTSADAKLVGKCDIDQEFSDTQPQRKRRVSFGMVAYVKRDDSSQHEISPLNDEVPLFKSPKERFSASKVMREAIVPFERENERYLETNQRIPKIQVTLTEEFAASNEESTFYLADDDGSVSMTKQGCDNFGYLTEGEENEDNDKSSLDEADQSRDKQQCRQELSPEKIVQKKISTQSLPVGVGRVEARRLSWQSDDSSVPKGILKNKTASSESLASSNGSANERRFKVRKDSIALFTDKHGQVGLLELRKEHSKNWKERFNIQGIWSKRKEIIQAKKTHLFVFAIFSCILAFVIVGLHLHSIHKENLAIARKVLFDAKSRELHLFDSDDSDQISGTLGLTIPKWQLPLHCHANYEEIHDRTCLIWKKFGTLNINYIENSVKCYNISWKMEAGVTPTDCFDIGSSFWYGPSNASDNSWPISWQSFTFDTSSVRHSGSGTFEFVTEYYWLNTNGGAIYVDSRLPLQVSWNQGGNGKLCLSVLKLGDFYSKDNAQLLSMNYIVCNSNDMLKTHNFISKNFIPNLKEFPDISLMEFPHWSTASLEKNKKVNESVVLDLTKHLQHNGFNCSTIELDGQWENKIGDFSFSKVDFPNMSRILEAVTKLQCVYSLSLFPYFDINSRNFPDGLSRELFIKSIGKHVPALVKWQFGVGAMLDVSNTSARSWFTNKIRHLKSSYGIDTFRFTYGDLFWLPHKPVFSEKKLNPNKVKNLFSELFSSFGNLILESTSRSQHLSGFIGITSSVINYRNKRCLKNIISNVLNLGHLGYPLVMSDGFEIKTESFSEEVEYKRPSRDLFIRWMQLSTFFPSMRYTVKPWEYDKEVIQFARNMSQFHKQVVLPEIKKLEPEILQGKPIMRPLWWQHPKDSNSFQINDQFLLGDNYLVAPVLCEGNGSVAKRDIYIPGGIWRDIISNTIIPGPKWIYAYKVKQKEIPLFKQEELHFSVQ